MNRLSLERRAAVIRALVEGNSVRATCRLTGTAKGTVLRLLMEVGGACSVYQHRELRGLTCQRVQLDEIWSFVGAKERNLSKEERQTGQRGDVWTWTAIDADTKLVMSWQVGNRSWEYARLFVDDLASRLTNRVQLSTDGHRAYLQAVENAFGWNGVDYGVLEKIYGRPAEGPGAGRYSPPEVVGIKKTAVMGNPAPAAISTSYVERQNLTMRMQMRRFTRLTNAFSKKVENHAAAISLHFMWYNFARPHMTLTKEKKGIHTTPAMAAGKADHVWTAEEIVMLSDLNYHSS